MAPYVPLSPATLLAFLPLVEPHRGWTAKRRIVEAVGSFEGGCWYSSGDAAHWLGLSTARCRAHLAELDAGRVLLREGGPGARKFWVEVNPDLGAWKVPWLVSRQELEVRLVWHRSQVAAGPGERFIARPMAARCGAVIARAWVARSEPVNGAIPRDPGSRANGQERATENSGTARPWGARSSEVGRAVLGRAVIDPSAPGGVFATGAGGVPSPEVGPFDGDAEEEEPISEGVIKRARAAIFAHTDAPARGGRFLNGPPLDLTKRLIREHGVDAFVEACPTVPAGNMVPRFLEHLAHVLAGDAEPTDTRHHAERAATIRQLLEAVPDHPDHESLEQELAECETVLAAATGGTR